MRVLVAFLCFFRLLFTGVLPARAANYLPEESARGLLASGDEAPADGAAAERGPAAEEAQTDQPGDASAAEAPAADARSERAEPARREGKKPAATADKHREGALVLLSLLQREGRLVDFLREDLGEHDDDAIGAAVRDIHRGCQKVLEDHFGIEPVMPGDEDDAVDVPRGFDPTEIRLIGEVDGDPPFRGVLRHHGWRVTEVNFPTLAEGVDRRVIASAEVEVQ